MAMSRQVEIDRILEKGIKSEMDYERAMIADRKLRVLAKEHPSLKTKRAKLRDLIEDYENSSWTGVRVSASKIQRSDRAEEQAERERKFIADRKKLIRSELKKVGLTQQELGKILGHTSKTHMSALMNGLATFQLNDLILISKLLNIHMDNLVPPFLPEKKRKTAITRIKKLKNPKLKLDDNHELVSD